MEYGFVEKGPFETRSEKGRQCFWKRRWGRKGGCHPRACQEVCGRVSFFCFFLHLNKLFSGRQCCVVLKALGSHRMALWTRGHS